MDALIRAHRPSSLPRACRAVGWLAVAGLLVLALVGPWSSGTTAAPGEAPPGNNGTVKTHDGGTEPDPIVRDDPKVCTFHLHGFFFDPGQGGTWWIESWEPTGTGSTVLSGAYGADEQGEFRTPASPATYSLTDGHYKLFWQGIGDESHEVKHKVFWVECPPVPPPPPVQPASLTVIKHVESGMAAASAFQIHVRLGVTDIAGSPRAGADAPGVEFHELSAGTYAVSEDAVAGYSGSVGGDCTPAGSVTLAAGDHKTCMITNRFSGGGGGGGGGNPTQPQPVVTPSPTPSPTGEVLAVSGTPRPTVPPTDTDPSPSAPIDAGRAALLALATLIASVLVLSSAAATVRINGRG